MGGSNGLPSGDESARFAPCFIKKRSRKNTEFLNRKQSFSPYFKEICDVGVYVSGKGGRKSVQIVSFIAFLNPTPVTRVAASNEDGTPTCRHPK